VALRYAAARCCGTEHRGQIVGCPLMPAARTEQLRMAGGSIKTAVQRRDARRQELDLCMRDGAILAAEIAHLERAQIMVLAQIEEASDLRRDEAHRAVDVGRRPRRRINAGFRFGEVLRLDPRNPGGAGLSAGWSMAVRRP